MASTTQLPKFAQHVRAVLATLGTVGPMVSAYLDGQLSVSAIAHDPAMLDALLGNLGIAVTSATLFGVSYTEWFRRALVWIGYAYDHINESSLPDAVHPRMNKIAEAVYALRAAGQDVESMRAAYNDLYDVVVQAVDDEIASESAPSTT